MDWLNEVTDIIQKYRPAAVNVPGSVDADFDRLSRVAPSSTVSDGLAEAFRSGQTPPFASMLSGLFERSPSTQKTTILNTLIATLGPAFVSQILAKQGANRAAKELEGGGTRISPELVEQMPSTSIEAVAAEAEKKDPSVIDRISNFYADQPALIKTLGGLALTVVMAKIAQRDDRTAQQRDGDQTFETIKVAALAVGDFLAKFSNASQERTGTPQEASNLLVSNVSALEVRPEQPLTVGLSSAPEPQVPHSQIAPGVTSSLESPSGPSQPGTLDEAFGAHGRVTTNFADNAVGDNVRSLAVQPDGKILVAGYVDTGQGPTWTDFAIARYNEDGLLDPVLRQYSDRRANHVTNRSRANE